MSNTQSTDFETMALNAFNEFKADQTQSNLDAILSLGITVRQLKNNKWQRINYALPIKMQMILLYGYNENKVLVPVSIGCY